MGSYFKTDHSAYVQGKGSDRFYPEDKLTRAEAATMIYSLLKETPAAEGQHFTDVKPESWYWKYVEGMYAIGAVEGYGDGTFLPQRQVTRAEFVTMLYRFFEPKSAEVTFPDVAESNWAYPQISNAVAYGWVSGYPDGTFHPDSSITRAEAVVILNRMLGRTPDKAAINGADNRKILCFLDVSFTHWAYYYIMEAAIDHTVTENEDGTENWNTYSYQVDRAPGAHMIGTDLYMVDEDGHYVHSATSGVLKFDSSGRYTTGNADLDRRLTALVQRYCVAGDTAQNNFHRLYNYVLQHFTYVNRVKIQEGAAGWEEDRALEMLQKGSGNCYCYAGLVTVLARKLGYQATGISGMVYLPWNDSIGDIPHGWVEISIDGQTFLCDAQQDVSGKGRGYHWDLFMKSYSNPTVEPKYFLNGKPLR